MLDSSPEKTGLSYSEALAEIRKGNRGGRIAWQSNKIFVFMIQGNKLTPDYIQQSPGFPQSVKNYYQDVLTKEDRVNLSAFLCVQLIDNNILSGWVPTPNDLTAQDWVIYDKQKTWE